MDLAVGAIIIAEDETRWRVYSIARKGTRHVFVALHLTETKVLTGGVNYVTWSQAEDAWRLRTPSAG